MHAADLVKDLIRADLCKLAALIHATELVVFEIRRGDTRPWLKTFELLAHVRPDDSTPEQRAAAIAAFEDLVRKCVAEWRDGAIAVAPANEAGLRQYCLVALLGEGFHCRGAIAMIVRCADLTEAKARLRILRGR